MDRRSAYLQNKKNGYTDPCRNHNNVDQIRKGYFKYHTDCSFVCCLRDTVFYGSNTPLDIRGSPPDAYTSEADNRCSESTIIIADLKKYKVTNTTEIEELPCTMYGLIPETILCNDLQVLQTMAAEPV